MQFLESGDVATEINRSRVSRELGFQVPGRILSPSTFGWQSHVSGFAANARHDYVKQEKGSNPYICVQAWQAPSLLGGPVNW